MSRLGPTEFAECFGPSNGRTLAATILFHSGDGRKPIDTFFQAIVLTVSGLLPIMNPFSTAPLFASLTASFDAKKRTRQALMGCIYAFGILVVFLLLGAAIIDFFGISLPGIRVAGGLIISTIGFRMLFPDLQAKPGSATDAQNQELDFSVPVRLSPTPTTSRVRPLS